jgi:hypothetical protein
MGLTQQLEAKELCADVDELPLCFRDQPLEVLLVIACQGR